jgi:uncharacterized protein YbaR (Trm112 family)
MKSESTQEALFDASVLSRLACPACLGDLRIEASGKAETRLVCAECGRGYPIVDGIPVLIAGRETSRRE